MVKVSRPKLRYKVSCKFIENFIEFIINNYISSDEIVIINNYIIF